MKLLILLVLAVLCTLISTQDSTTISTTDQDEGDVFLNVKNLTIDEVHLNLQSLHAQVNLQAKLGKLLTINAGVDVDIANTTLTVKGVNTQVMLKVNLTNLYRIIDRTLKSVDKDSSILTGIVDVSNGLLSTVTNSGLTTTRTIDQLGQIIERVSNAAGTITSQSIVANVSSMQVASTTTNAAGQTVKRVVDSKSGVNIDVTYSSSHAVLNVKVVE
jgi:hypothetical protein